MFLTMDHWIRSIIDVVVQVGTHLLLPVMALLFVGAVVLRGLMFYTVKRQEWFVNEFHKRVLRAQDKLPAGSIQSFYVFAKKYLEKTFYELFVVRGIQMRRRIDFIMSPSDRLFMVQPGCARIVHDFQRNLKSLKKGGNTPQFEQIAKVCLEENPCFGRLFGIFPIGVINDALALLPGFFILGGIFGTFISIMKALPELGNLNMGDIEGTKEAMAAFIGKVSISMAASVTGIMLSVALSVISSFWSAERTFVSTVDRLASTLGFLWNSSVTNEVPEGLAKFDEKRDPLEALAEASIEKELEKAGVLKELETAPAPDSKRAA